MTLCPTSISSNEDKDAWHWLGLAISLAYSQGLNRNIITANPTLRRKHLERRLWWTAFIRDRTLALYANGSWARPVRIKREDCWIELLSLEDFDIDEKEERNEEIDEIRARKVAEECIERATICWCSNDGLISNHLSTSISLPPSTVAQTQNIFMTQHESHVEAEEHYSLNTSTSASFYTPVFESPEDAEYNVAGSASPSMNDCLTPHEETSEFAAEDLGQKSFCQSPLGGGYGVDGEYDDYLEYLKAPARQREQGQVAVIG